MRVFPQKPKVSQKTVSVTSTKPDRAFSGQRYSLESVIGLQSLIGNQATPYVLEARRRNDKGNSTATSNTDYSSGSSQIYMQANESASIQAAPRSGVPTIAIQLASDPSPPRELDLENLPPHQMGGEPTPDSGDAISPLRSSEEAQPEETKRLEKQPPAPVQARREGPVPVNVRPGHLEANLGEGKRLDRPMLEKAGAFFGHDFRNLRIHADARGNRAARSFNALALTVGNHVAFAAGRYEPGTPAGKRLIAHELTHVVQQSHGLGADVLRAGIGIPGDRYEVEAERNAERFASGQEAAIGDVVAPRSGTANAALQLYTGSAAATYARRWALSTNPSYPRFPNDCTNFVSQAVLAGGWSMVGGSCSDRKRNSVWWYGRWKCWYPTVRASYTWAGAQNFYNFVSTSGRGTAAAYVRNLRIGDVLQMAFSGTHIGHTMIVTNKKNNNLFLSYHTRNHLNRPFWGPGGILAAYPRANYYAWRL